MNDESPSETGPNRGQTGKKYRLLTLDALHSQTAAYRETNTLISEVTADLGGSEHLSAAERQMVQHGAVLGAIASVLLIAAMGEDLKPEELETFRRLTERQEPPKERVPPRRPAAFKCRSAQSPNSAVLAGTELPAGSMAHIARPAAAGMLARNRAAPVVASAWAAARRSTALRPRDSVHQQQASASPEATAPRRQRHSVPHRDDPPASRYSGRARAEG